MSKYYDDDTYSLPDFPPKDLNNDFDTDYFQLKEEEHERIRIEKLRNIGSTI